MANQSSCQSNGAKNTKMSFFKFDGKDRGLPVELFIELVESVCAGLDPESCVNFSKDGMSERLWTMAKESNADKDWQQTRQFLLDEFGQKGDYNLIDCLHLLSSLMRQSHEDPLGHLLRVKFCVDKIETLTQSSDDVWLKLLYLQNIQMPLSAVEEQLDNLLQEVNKNLAIFRNRNIKEEIFPESFDVQGGASEEKTEPIDFEIKLEAFDDPLDVKLVNNGFALHEDKVIDGISGTEDWSMDFDEDIELSKRKKKRKRRNKAMSPKNEVKIHQPKTGFVPGQAPIYWNSIDDVNWDNPMNQQVFPSKEPGKKHDYVCAICVRQGKKEVISGRYEFGTHSRTHHNGNTLICDTCNYTTKVVELLVSHRYVKHKKITEGFEEMHTCTKDGCDKKFVTKLELAKHIYKHDAVPEQGVCPICGKVFTCKSVVKEHIIKIHEGQKREQCDICQKWFQEAAYLKKHKALIHRVGRPEAYEVVCDVCGKVCQDRSVMRDHIKRVHQKLRRYDCPDCEKKFYIKSELKKHQISAHKQGDEFACPHCGMLKDSSHALKTHVNSVHLNKKQFHCRECDSWFTASYTLAFHVATRHLGFSQKEAKKPESIALARENYAFEKVKDEDAMIGNPAGHQKSKRAAGSHND